MKILLNIFALVSAAVFPQLATAASFPFMIQAPTANWADARQQNGCEEASSIMAVAWARGEALPTGKTAEKYILDMADWETKRYKVGNDTSVADTAERLLKTYQGFINYRVLNKISLTDLIKNIQAGRAVILPANGKKLRNPNFSAGGPDLHMLLVIGYDAKTKEFITNDPGTRRGQNYRYPAQRLYDAIRDYPTSEKKIVKDLGKNVIVVSKVNDTN
jgi:hypothetical protein